MTSTSSQDGPERVPVLLLKTRSTPNDAYEEILSRPRDGFNFEPLFVPVLQHRFEPDGMESLRRLLTDRGISKDPTGASYGGLIFTSQRAVEAFAHLAEEGVGNENWPHLQDVPIYSVGPATTRALRAIKPEAPLQIFGEHTGNGDALARFILEHYGAWYEDRSLKPPLLFLVGEQRRDIIPKTLTDPSLDDGRRIGVTELVVYGTGEMASFPADFAHVLSATETRSSRWVVVFSPTGCDSMLRGLGILAEGSGKVEAPVDATKGRTTFVATIGPTTRDYLRSNFDFEPDACAEKPSPEGVWASITLI